jgi:hypothetical protein
LEIDCRKLILAVFRAVIFMAKFSVVTSAIVVHIADTSSNLWLEQLLYSLGSGRISPLQNFFHA